MNDTVNDVTCAFIFYTFVVVSTFIHHFNEKKFRGYFLEQFHIWMVKITSMGIIET